MASDSDKSKSLAGDITSAISDFPSIVGKFWSAVAGPMFELAITLAVLCFVLGLDQQHPLSHLPPVGLLPDASVQRALQFYGVTFAVPVAVFILLLGIAQANSRLLRTIGGIVPGELVPNTTNLFTANADKFDVLTIWKHYPNLEINGLNSKIDTEIAREDDLDPNRTVLTSVRTMHNQVRTFWGPANFTKGLLALAIVSAITVSILYRTELEWRRLVLLAIVVAIVLTQLATRRILWERRYNRQKVSDYRYFLQLKDNSGQNSISPEDRSRLERLEQLRTIADFEGSWRLNFLPSGLGSDFRELGKAVTPWFWDWKKHQRLLDKRSNRSIGINP